MRDGPGHSLVQAQPREAGRRFEDIGHWASPKVKTYPINGISRPARTFCGGRRYPGSRTQARSFGGTRYLSPQRLAPIQKRLFAPAYTGMVTRQRIARFTNG